MDQKAGKTELLAAIERELKDIQWAQQAVALLVATCLMGLALGDDPDGAGMEG